MNFLLDCEFFDEAEWFLMGLIVGFVLRRMQRHRKGFHLLNVCMDFKECICSNIGCMMLVDRRIKVVQFGVDW